MDEIYDIISQAWTIPGDIFAGIGEFKTLFYPEEAIFVTPDNYRFLPIIGAIVVAVVLALYIFSRRRVRPVIGVGTCIWAACFIAGLIWLSVWIHRGLCSATLSVIFAYTAVLTVGGSLTVTREAALTRLDEYDMAPGRFRFLGRIIRVARDVGAIALATAMAYIAIEEPLFSEWVALEHNMVVISLVVIALVIGFFYFITMRRGAGIWIGVACCGVLGLAAYFVYEFKGSPLAPSDFLAIDTAFDVLDQYEYIYTSKALTGIICCAIAAIPCLYVRPPKRRPKYRALFAACWNIPLAIACACGLWGMTHNINYKTDYGVTLYAWDPLVSYSNQGFVPTFIAEAQLMVIEPPEGYTDEAAAAFITQLATDYDNTIGNSEERKAAVAQFNEIQPSIVVVMNESFSDLSLIDGMGVGYEGPEYFNFGLDDALYKGYFPVSTIGGGTCNTEFEFFTSTSFGYIGGGKTPYMFYNLSQVDSLPKQFAALGYPTTAIHCDLATNWNRDNIYPQIGFDTFLDISSFPEDAPRLRNLVRDSATYDMVLDILRSTDEPQFIWDLTEMGHGGYYMGGIPEELWADYPLEDVVGPDRAYAGKEYLSVVNGMDQDLHYFIDELRALDKPVVLVFFGDHQPGFSTWFAHELYPDGSGFELAMAQAQTAFTVWANYDVAGIDQVSTQDVIDSSQLAAVTLNAIGAPLSDFQKAQMVEHAQIHAINKLGYMGGDGVWYSLNDHDTSWYQAYLDMQAATYFNFATKI